MRTKNTFITKVQPPMVSGVKNERVVGTHEIGEVPSPVARVRPTEAATNAKPNTITTIRIAMLGIVLSKNACHLSVMFTGFLSLLGGNSTDALNHLGGKRCALYKRDNPIIRKHLFGL